MMMNWYKPAAFLVRDFTIARTYKFAYALELLGIVFYVAGLYFLSKIVGGVVPHDVELYGADYFSFVLIGVAFSGYITLSLGSFAEAIREAQLEGTLESLLVTPTSLSTIILSAALYPFIFTTFSVIIYFFFGVALFGFRLGNANYLSAVFILILSMVACSGLGLLSAAFVMMFKKGSPLGWIIGSLSTLLSGILYPVSVLPWWLQQLSLLLPLTYSLDGLRHALLENYPLAELLPDIGALALFTMVLLPAGLIAFSYATRVAKVEGSVSNY